MLTLDKNRVARRFKKALATYTRQARVQNHMANRLLVILRQNFGATFDRVLEIGCGAGLLTRKFFRIFSSRIFFANDLVPEVQACLESVDPRIHFLAGDAETIQLFPRQLDLIISNATFQWLHDLAPLLNKLSGLLAPGGALVFSTFGPENLRELAGLMKLRLPYPAPSELKTLCQSHFEICCQEEEKQTLYFPTVFSVLKHLQALGVNSLQSHTWTKAGWHDLVSRYYENYGAPQGLPLTYHPVYFALKKG